MTSRATIDISHADRVLFPADGITKGAMVDYYAAVADFMLPHLRDRPLTLWRFPRGIHEKGFVQQDLDESLPDWMDGAQVPKENGTVVHPVVDKPAALVWLANQNCVTPHVWLSRTTSLHTPDRLVFDLDPSGRDFGAVRSTAHAVAGALEDLGLVPYLQTTGSRGLHVVTPIAGDTDFDAARDFTRDLAAVVAADDPEHRTVQMRKDKRGDRVYIDVMRNAYAQTRVAPYAVRSRDGAPVATPLTWDELDDKGLRPDGFTINDVPERLDTRGDPWSGIARHARSLTRPIQRLAKLPDAHA